MKNGLQIEPDDNVVVALRDIRKEETLLNDLLAIEAIPAKHKAALKDFQPGDPIRMYGVTVGVATERIRKGGLLTVRNVKHAAANYLAREAGGAAWNEPGVEAWKTSSFFGYKRTGGSVGTANHWLVVPLVFCENRNLRVMRKALEEALGYDRESHYKGFVNRLVDLHRVGATHEALLTENLEGSNGGQAPYFQNIDGIKFLEHGLGCGGTRQDAESLCGLLAGYITHPNVAGATVLSLGCQNAQVALLEAAIAKRAPEFDRPLQIFEQQKWLSEEAMLGEALKRLFLGLESANEMERQAAPLSRLVLGIECGGSDGLSGISANPLIGEVADRIVALGGRVILSEFPELCGVEQELLDRCIHPGDQERFIELMKTYAFRAEASGSALHMNPSVGNIADGLITDAMKSAGAARKGGTSPIVDVLDYPEAIRRGGLSLLCTPGGDVESTTAMVGTGANLILFSTGLGTPTGNPLAPTLKISSNSDLFQRMSDIIDFDAGPVIDGRAGFPELAEGLLQMVVDTASGKYVPKAVRLGQDDFLPWKRGISL